MKSTPLNGKAMAVGALDFLVNCIGVPVLIDPIVTFDGVPYWSEGRLMFLERDEIASLRDRFDGCEAALDMEMRIGL